MVRRKSAYPVWDVCHQIFEETKSKLFKSEDFKKSGNPEKTETG